MVAVLFRGTPSLPSGLLTAGGLSFKDLGQVEHAHYPQAGLTAISLRMAEEGCHIVIADLKEDQLKATAADVAQKTGRKAVPVKCDVSQEADVQNLFDVAMKIMRYLRVMRFRKFSRC